MADQKVYANLNEYLKTKAILPNTPEMEAFLGVGYQGMTVEKAEAILEAAKKNPSAFLLNQESEKARAFLEAYHTAPIVVAKRAAWVPPIMAE